MATKSAALPTPRASRSMVLSFGMFNVNIAMAPLFKTDASAVSGHKHCVEHHGQVKQAWFCEHGDHYVSGDEIETAYEYGGMSIVLSADEVRSAESDRDGVVTLKKSCRVDDIDPSYYEKTYLIWPQAGGPNAEAFASLSTAMRSMDAALIGQVVVSKTDRMLVIRWSDEHGCVVGHVCNFAANMKHDAVALVAEAGIEPSPEFVAQAEMLIGTLLGDFDPELVEDTYAARLEAILSSPRKVTTTVTPISEATTPNIMEALRASIAEAQATA